MYFSQVVNRRASSTDLIHTKGNKFLSIITLSSLPRLLPPLSTPHPSTEAHHNLNIIFSSKHMNREVLISCHKDSRPICLGKKIKLLNPPDKTSCSYKRVPQVRISFRNSLLLCKLLYCYCL